MTPTALPVEQLAPKTEDEVRERLAAGKLVEGLQHMSPEYLKGIRRILTVSADTELVSAPSYLRAARNAFTSSSPSPSHAPAGADPVPAKPSALTAGATAGV